MYFEIKDPKKHKDMYVSYVITDIEGNTVDIAAVRLTELMTLSTVNLPENGPLFMTVISVNLDFMTVCTELNKHVIRHGRNDLAPRVNSIFSGFKRNAGRKGSPVQCIETGEKWASVWVCCNLKGITYSQMMSHLNGRPGYRTVKGQTYKRIDIV